MEKTMIAGSPLELRTKRSRRDRVARSLVPLGERLCRWCFSGKLVDYVSVRLFKRQVLNEMRVIKNALYPKDEDAEHLAFLELELAEIEQVETGRLSVQEYNRLGEIHRAWRGLASSRLLTRFTEIQLQQRRRQVI